MKDYKKILKGVVNIIATTEKTDIGFANICSYLSDNCDELFESEDEKIRKELIEHIKANKWADYVLFQKFSPDDVIAWLEKQESVEEIVERCKKSWYNEGKIAGMAEGLSDDEKYQQGWHDALEAWKDMRLEVYAQASGNKHEPNDSDDTTKMFSLNDIDEIFEKIAETYEEKPLLKVETKFHEGEWIVNRNGGLWKIKKIFKNTYDIESLCGESLQPIKTVDMDCHLWTIKDAKPGDILSNGKMIVIFKEFEEPSYREHIIAYIGLDCIGAIQVTDGTWQLGADKAHPATKEQRDTLFTKMREAGYEWNGEKKELKKSEPKFKVKYAGNEYNVLKIKEIAGVMYYGIEDEPNHIDYVLPENCEIISGYGVKEKGNSYPTKSATFSGQNPAWSEEDEKNLKIAIWYVENPALRVKDTMLSEWLKSIKGRVQPQPHWKPSEEQIQCLHDAIEHYHTNGYPASKLNELYEQMSKIYKL